MKKFNKVQAAVTAITTALALAPAGLVRAADYNYDSSTGGVASAGFLAGSLIFLLLLAVVGVGFLIFWILMLIDVLQRQNWKDDNQKNTWLIILIVSWVVGLSWLAAIVYYIAIRKPLGKAQKATVVAPPVAEEPTKK